MIRLIKPIIFNIISSTCHMKKYCETILQFELSHVIQYANFVNKSPCKSKIHLTFRFTLSCNITAVAHSIYYIFYSSWKTHIARAILLYSDTMNLLKKSITNRIGRKTKPTTNVNGANKTNKTYITSNKIASITQAPWTTTKHVYICVVLIIKIITMNHRKDHSK